MNSNLDPNDNILNITYRAVENFNKTHNFGTQKRTIKVLVWEDDLYKFTTPEKEAEWEAIIKNRSFNSDELLQALDHCYKQNGWGSRTGFTYEEIQDLKQIISALEPSSLRKDVLHSLEWEEIHKYEDIWLKDPVITEAMKDLKHPFWDTSKGYALEKLQMHAEFNYEEDLVRPFLARRIEEGAIKDGEVVDWEAELELFKKTVSEEDIERAQEYCSTVYVDVRKDIIDELEPDDLDRFITDWFNIRTK